MSAAWQSGFMIVSGLLMMILLALLPRRLEGIPLATAAVAIYLVIWLIAYFFMDAENPLTTAYVAWPFLGGVAGVGVLLFTKDLLWKTILLSFSALLVLVVMLPYLILGTYTLNDAWIPTLVLCTWLVLFAPQVEAIFGRAFTTEQIGQIGGQH